MKLYNCIFVLIFALSCKNNPPFEETLLKDGVPLALAEYRHGQVSNVEYGLSFTIPKEKEDPINAKLILTLHISESDAPLYLDFKEDADHLKSVMVNGKSEEIDHRNEHLVIGPQNLKSGSNQIEIEFVMGELSLNRNEEYLYTLLVPDRARTLFPCFDQPNIKAKYTLTITAPNDWQVRCGAPEKNALQKEGFTVHEFGQTENISTYLFSFVAGKFQSASENPEGFDMTLLYRENDTAKISRSLPVIFDSHYRSVKFLEDYTAYGFPFQKLDYAAIPGFQYGGMEHVGAIQYRESALFLDESATENRRLSRAKLIAHETAHMWFGDLVTMDWFNDVWMKEVFANFMADKIVNPAFPEIDHNLAFMVTHYPRAYGEDRTLGTNPIRQPLDNLNDAGSLYGSIIYNKAPIMMRQLETVMGKPAFQKGIQNYIKNYAYENAVWNDLVEILDQETDTDLKTWSKIWVDSSSRPIFDQTVSYADDGTITKFELDQSAEDGSDGIWPQTFDIALTYPDTVISLTANIIERKTNLDQAKGLKKPNSIVYNSNGLGYGVFPVDVSSLDNIPDLEDPVARGYAYINSYENTLNGNIPVEAAFELFRKGIATEHNELLINLISGYLGSMYWNYLTEAQRERYQQPLENQLLQQLQSELPPNIKKTLFGRFRSIAYSDSGKNTLYSIWNKTKVIHDLKLNQDDYTAMAMDLALYGHPEQRKILEKAKSELTNPDKLERFEFLLPVLSNDVAERDAFFESLKAEENRAKESWTLTALNYLNHPLRQQGSIKYLKPSLALLDEIQKTGDIFFPKGWLNNTIGAYTSAKANTILEDFIAENPDLNPALLKKLLQASDDLRRVQLLGKKVDRGND